MKKYLSVALLFLAFVAYSQTPCVSGSAGEYPCDNYDLQSHIPIATLAISLGNPEGSDVWGWTDPTTQREYALAAMTNSTAFVDVTDPANPIYLGRLDTENGSTSFWRDVKVYNNHAFIVADNVGSHGMQVFDLTRLRGVSTPNNNFSADAVFSGVSSCHNIVINEASGFAYLVGCNTFSGGVHFVDISDPKNPVSAGGYSAEGYTHDAQVITYSGPDTTYTGREIFVGSNGSSGSGDKVVILDVTDKNNVVKIAEITYTAMGYTHQGWFTEDHRYFILGDETDELNLGFNTRTLIFDFADLDNPSLHGTYEGATQAIDHNGYVKGNTYYLANYTRGLRVFDINNISTPAAPMVEIGSFDTHPNSDGTSFSGAWSVYPYFQSNNILINDINRGLFVVRESGTASTNLLDAKAVNAFPNPVQRGNLFTVATRNAFERLEVYNVLGSVVYRQDNIQQNSFDMPTHQLTSGIYFAKIDALTPVKFIVD